MFSSISAKQHKSFAKSISIILCGVLLFGMLFSSFFVSTEFMHDCSGEDCPICQMVAICDNFVNQLGCGIIFLAAALLFIFVKSGEKNYSCPLFIAPTPVRQKVRLNN